MATGNFQFIFFSLIFKFRFIGRQHFVFHIEIVVRNENQFFISNLTAEQFNEFQVAGGIGVEDKGAAGFNIFYES